MTGGDSTKTDPSIIIKDIVAFIQGAVERGQVIKYEIFPSIWEGCNLNQEFYVHIKVLPK